MSVSAESSLGRDCSQHAIDQWFDICTLCLLLLERCHEGLGLLRRREHQKSLFAFATGCQFAAPRITLSRLCRLGRGSRWTRFSQ